MHVIPGSTGRLDMDAARKLVLLLCVVALLLQGCAGGPSRRDLASDGPALAITGHDHADHERTPTGHRDAIVAIYVAVAVVITVAFVIDLILIPLAASRHCHYFPCCTALIDCCR